MAALVVDRVTSGSGGLGPDTAVASPAIEPHDEPALLPVPPAEIPETGQEGRLDCLADRLEDLAERHSLAGVAVADAFCPPPAWLAPNGPVSVVETAGMDRARDFAARHELKAVRYCQELWMTDSPSRGDFLDAIDESHAANHIRQ